MLECLDGMSDDSDLEDDIDLPAYFHRDPWTEPKKDNNGYMNIKVLLANYLPRSGASSLNTKFELIGHNNFA